MTETVFVAIGYLIGLALLVALAAGSFWLAITAVQALAGAIS